MFLSPNTYHVTALVQHQLLASSRRDGEGDRLLRIAYGMDTLSEFRGPASERDQRVQLHGYIFDTLTWWYILVRHRRRIGTAISQPRSSIAARAERMDSPL
jgi:hypothetical protein